MFRAKQLIKSFSHAWRGLLILSRTEQSFRLQVLLGLAALFLACFLSITTFEFIVILLLIVSVLVLEMINSIFERLVDSFKPRIHPIVGEIKDIMAAAVLVASIFSAAIGLVIFLPRILTLLLA